MAIASDTFENIRHIYYVARQKSVLNVSELLVSVPSIFKRLTESLFQKPQPIYSAILIYLSDAIVLLIKITQLMYTLYLAICFKKTI